jgi:hypothetical protein
MRASTFGGSKWQPNWVPWCKPGPLNTRDDDELWSQRPRPATYPGAGHDYEDIQDRNDDIQKGGATAMTWHNDMLWTRDDVPLACMAWNSFPQVAHRGRYGGSEVVGFDLRVQPLTVERGMLTSTSTTKSTVTSTTTTVHSSLRGDHHPLPSTTTVFQKKKVLPPLPDPLFWWVPPSGGLWLAPPRGLSAADLAAGMNKLASVFKTNPAAMVDPELVRRRFMIDWHRQELLHAQDLAIAHLRTPMLAMTAMKNSPEKPAPDPQTRTPLTPHTPDLMRVNRNRGRTSPTQTWQTKTSQTSPTLTRVTQHTSPMSGSSLKSSPGTGSSPEIVQTTKKARNPTRE